MAKKSKRIDVKKTIKEIKEANNSKNHKDSNLFAWIATFLSIIGFVIAIVIKKEDKYVMYYAKHSLVIFIIGLVLGIISSILLIIPIIGRLIYAASTLFTVGLWLLSWTYALTSKQKVIPVITDLANKFDF